MGGGDRSRKALFSPFEVSKMPILGDPGADSGDVGKSKRAGKCGAKKSKERPEEPLATMSYQTSSKWSPPFWLNSAISKWM